MLEELGSAVDAVIAEILAISEPVVLRQFPANGTSVPPPHSAEAFELARERQLTTFRALATRAREVRSLGQLRSLSADLASATAELRQQLGLPTEAINAAIEAELSAAGPRIGQMR